MGNLIMKKYLFAVMAALIALPAIAADNFPTKATAAPAWLPTSGFYAGLYTEGGGGPVTATVPGVNPASLTTTTAAIGAAVGYAFKSTPTSPFTYQVEADVCAKNFNGQNAGFAVASPLCLEQSFMVFAPASYIMTAINFLNLPNPFGQLAAIVVPPGQTVTSTQLGIGGGAYWNDMTVAFLGVGSNKVWSVNPELKIAIQDTLSNKVVLQSFLKIDFESETILFGTHATSAQKGVGARAGLAVNF